MWFPSSGFVRASRVGEKNMASSSGCAINKHIRLLYSSGNVRAKGDVVVEDKVQKRKIAAIAKPSETRVCGFMSCIVSARAQQRRKR